MSFPSTKRSGKHNKYEFLRAVDKCKDNYKCTIFLSCKICVQRFLSMNSCFCFRMQNKKNFIGFNWTENILMRKENNRTKKYYNSSFLITNARKYHYYITTQNVNVQVLLFMIHTLPCSHYRIFILNMSHTTCKVAQFLINAGAAFLQIIFYFKLSRTRSCWISFKIF